MVLWATIVLFHFLETVMARHPIYTVSLAMLSACIANGQCRPDRWQPMMSGAAIFTFLNFIYFSCLVVFYPAYIDHIWRPKYRSGWLLAGGSMEEELLFAGTLGLMWCSLYEHLYWHQYLPEAST